MINQLSTCMLLHERYFGVEFILVPTFYVLVYIFLRMQCHVLNFIERDFCLIRYIILVIDTRHINIDITIAWLSTKSLAFIMQNCSSSIVGSV